MLRVCQQLASTVQNVQQSLLLLVTQATDLSLLFCCLWRNVEVSCHKHFVVISGNQHCRLLPAVCRNNLRHTGRAPLATALTTPPCCSVNTGSQARYRLRIAISAYFTCIRRPRQGGGVPVGILLCRLARITRMVWLPDGEKIFKISLFVLT